MGWACSATVARAGRQPRGQGGGAPAPGGGVLPAPRRRAPDNSRQTPFVPRPFDGRSIMPVPLASSGSSGASSTSSTSSSSSSFSSEEESSWSYHYPQPYQQAIADFEYLPAQLRAPEAGSEYPKPSRISVEDMRSGDGSQGWTWVDSKDSLAVLASALKAEAETETGGGGGDSGGSARHPTVAVDLEHHSYRSFQGLTACCSSRRRRRTLWTCSRRRCSRTSKVLGPTFSDPRVVKVFRNETSDVKWLQRDFGLYW